jgi:enoyl-CoA hydratase
MTDDVLMVDIADRVAVVTLNRPEARNALNRALRRALAETMGDLDTDAEVDVVVLTGADPAFCAGLDLKEIGAGGFGPPSPPSADGRRLPFPPMATPVIGAVNGPAATGGLEIALLCHFLIASDRARFADTHARVGIQPGWGLTVLLPQAVGVRRARQMSATGNYLDAETAHRWGLVNEVVAHEQLLPRCRALAADIGSNDRAAVRRLLRTYEEGSQVTGAEAWRIEATVSAEWSRSGEGAAGEIERRRLAILERGRDQTRLPS